MAMIFLGFDFTFLGLLFVLPFPILPTLLTWGYYYVISNQNFNIEMNKFLGSSDIHGDRGLNYSSASWTEHYAAYPHLISLKKTSITMLGIALLSLAVPFGVCASLAYFVVSIPNQTGTGQIYSDIAFFLIAAPVASYVGFLIFRRLGLSIIRAYVKNNHPQVWQYGYNIVGKVSD
jgi:hypothetical protein